MSKKHHVKTHTWIGGQLMTVSQSFESLEEAMAFVGAIDSQAKVYDEDGQLVHQQGDNTNTATYA